jgi:DNA-binding HxlR family transcriptional regulator
MNNFESKYGSCPMHYAMAILAGKWKCIILLKVYQSEVIRYNKLKEKLDPIAHKTLTQQLRELESDNLIHREQYNEVPPKVEYSLTEEGKTVIPVLECIYKWGETHSVKNDF